MLRLTSPAPDLGSLYAGLIGAYLGAVSVLIVYHLFTIQRWLEAASDVHAEWRQQKPVVASTSFVMAGILDQAKRRIRFPWPHIILLFVATSAFATLAVLAALELSEIPLYFTLPPPIVLWVMFIAATFEGRRRGRRLLEDVITDLEVS